MERARARGNSRPRRIPAFGKWNHNGDSDGNGNWPAAATSFFNLAEPYKAPETDRKDGDGCVAEAHGRRRSKVADSGAYAVRKSCFAVVPKAVDDDLYGVPPDMLCQKPARRRGWLRILLMTGCFRPGGACMAQRCDCPAMGP